MNHLKVYEQIIERAQRRTKINGKYEKHHIIPKSWDGEVYENNLVKLSLREHYIAHRLLRYIGLTYYERQSMLCALSFMINSKRYNIKNSKIYEKIRSEWMENHPSKNEDTKLKIIQSLREYRLRDGGFHIIYCGCGCGEEVRLSLDKDAKYFIRGHKTQKYYNIKKPEKRTWIKVLCACGCGEFIKIDRRREDEKCYIYKHSYCNSNPKKNYDQVSVSLKNTLSKLTKEEMDARLKNSLRNCDQEARHTAIQRGKASLLKMTKDNKTIEFWSYESVKIVGIEYRKIYYMIRNRNGNGYNGEHYQYIKKYTGGNKWKKLQPKNYEN